MITRVESAACLGIQAFTVRVEVDVSNGLPQFTIVGLPDPTVKESRERIRAAIKNSGYRFPPERITINLAPADIRKEGPAFDLPMALGILAASGALPEDRLENYIFLGELALDGTLRPFKGAIVVASSFGRRAPFVLPKESAEEAALEKTAVIYPVHSLRETVQFLCKELEIPPLGPRKPEIELNAPADAVNFSEVRGQGFAKRAIEIAVAGSHNLLMTWTQHHPDQLALPVHSQG